MACKILLMGKKSVGLEMELSDFVENMADCFYLTPSSEFHPKLKFKELEEWGSMMALLVVSMIDSCYNCTLSPQDFKEVQTIEELFEKVKLKCQ